MLKSLVAVACVALVASQKTVQAPEHPGWVKTGVPSQDQSVKVVVAVKNQNLDQLFDFVYKVSTPGSSEYKNYMSADEVNALTEPRQEDIDSVVAWLSAVGTPTVINGDVTVETVVAKAEQLFNAQYHSMEEVNGARTTARVGEYTIPEHVAKAVHGVYGLHGLPLPKKVQRERSSVEGMPPAVTPAVLTKAYDIKGVTPAGDTKNRMAVAEFQGQFMNKSDLKAFFEMYLPQSPAADSEVYAFHGGSQDGEGIEAQLDIQFIMGVAPGVKAEFYEQANNDFCADLKNWTSVLLAATDIPWVHSVSYGWQGNLTQIGCQPDEVTDIDANYAKLAARGVTIIFASGDSGSGYATPQPPQPHCDQTNPGKKDSMDTGDVLRVIKIGVPPNEPQEGAFICCSIAGEMGGAGYAGWVYNAPACTPGKPCEGNCTVMKTITGSKAMPGYVSGKAAPIPPTPPGPRINLWPSWPASSPFVTAVGATRFYQDMVDGGVEAAVSDEDHFGSGGGFSPWTFLAQGKWQSEAVAHYFKTVPAAGLPDSKGGYDKTGRATPDVSALGTGFAVINNGAALPGGVGGTSASAPTFAGMVALLNDALIQGGKKPLGLLNPFIYENAMAFTDVTIGWDKVGRGGGELAEGFNCSAGWDPVTGVGTPVFTKLLAAAMKSQQ